MNIGRYIFSQVVDYIPRYQFDKLYGSSDADQSLCPGENSTQGTHHYA